MGPIQPPTTPATSSAMPGMFGTRIPSSVAFAVGVLLFFLPFAEIKCSRTVLTQKSGLDIALGNKWKPVSENNYGKKNSSIYR